jgi:hypothetical protein
MIGPRLFARKTTGWRKAEFYFEENPMTEWSSSEIQRTIDEIKRRSLIDPEFRALALADALTAIAKVNPRPVPEGFKVRFAESGGASSRSAEQVRIIVLPDPLARTVEISDEELEEVAGGGDAPAPKLRT